MTASHIVPRGTYFIVFAALLVLLVLTVGIARIDFGRWNIVVAMSIAIAKALLIMLYFMHLKYSAPLTRTFAFAGILWLVILFSLLFSDYLNRDLTVL